MTFFLGQNSPLLHQSLGPMFEIPSPFATRYHPGREFQNQALQGRKAGIRIGCGGKQYQTASVGFGSGKPAKNASQTTLITQTTKNNSKDRARGF